MLLSSCINQPPNACWLPHHPVFLAGCTTIAEMRKRGKDFWGEFELYLSDLFVGLVLDVALVGLMAPAMVLGGAAGAAKLSSEWARRFGGAG